MRLILMIAGVSLAAGVAQARPLHSYAGLALADAGDRVAAIEQDSEPDAPKQAHGVLVVRATGDGHVLARLDPCPACAYSDPAFGPDGRIAFIMRDRKTGVSQLMLASGAATQTLASVDGLAARPRWSPDGTRIALLATPGARKETGATQAGVREVGEVGTVNDEQRIAIVQVRGVPAAGGALRLVSPADRFVYEYDWTPDGKGFVATSALGNGDANWWLATIDAIDAATGSVRTITRPETQANFPRVSPDGKTVAYIGGLMSDNGSVGGDIWTAPFAGGAAHVITPDFAATYASESKIGNAIDSKFTNISLTWTRESIAVTALAGDTMRAALVVGDFAARKVEVSVWQRKASFSAGDGNVVFSADGTTIATVVQDFDHPPAIYAGPASGPKQITHENDGYPPLVTARSVTWKSDGYDVQGWLLAPLGTPRGKAPLITDVHGGPAAASTPRFIWQGLDAALVRAGYWLFQPNPRGSYGQGEAFTQANKRDFGGGDLRDILAGIDAVEKAAPIDESRLGLMGGSYGGFMAMWANTQTDRFKAIAAGAGLSDWISYYGTNGINQWMIPYFGKSAYDDPDAYWAISAVKFIKRAKTPTLITVGERDIEVPPTQSVEYWNALKAVNVPTSLVIYPDEGHGIRQPDHAADERRRTVEWFDRYLKGAH